VGREPEATPGVVKNMRCRSRPGLTLVELLVVIAIIGLLVALLLPAVQTARESARRAQCANNLRQIGIGIQGYESSNGFFPPAGGWPASMNAPSSQHTVGWMVWILPWIDQNTLFSKLRTTERATTFCNPYGGILGPGVPFDNVQNGGAINGVTIPAFACPSSPLPVLRPFAVINPEPSNPSKYAHVALGTQSPMYTGISGAVTTAANGTDATSIDFGANNQAVNSTSTAACGKQSQRGAIVLRNPKPPAAFRDGLSSTLFAGEQSDFYVDPTGAKQDGRNDFRLSFLQGGIASETRLWNATTLRWAPNDRTWTNAGVGDNVYGVNRPLLSPHPGGVHGLLGDGATRFIADSIDLPTLYLLGIRDDRHAVGEY
jgi:prepilin-type N-terminal cleavage/methylation domain-containing protein